jgi:hypothetical protein
VGEIAHAAVSRRPPIPLYKSVARPEGYTYAAEVCSSCMTIFRRPRAKPYLCNDSQLLHRCSPAHSRLARRRSWGGCGVLTGLCGVETSAEAGECGPGLQAPLH